MSGPDLEPTGEAPLLPGDDPSERPNPDRLLAATRAERAGRLKVYLGAAAGVGKTCAMLDDAQERRRGGGSVLVALIEDHGRVDTRTRLAGLELFPRRPTPPGYPPEMDLDGVLGREPGLVLVDELAHTNAPGSRHPKRWQDVLELRDAGWEVWTTLNVQHLERAQDVVQRMTGVAVHETVPDHVLDQADAIEFIDLPPDELLSRLKAGKVYGPEATRRALGGFFRKGNLLALRQLALRRAAERVGGELDDFRDRVAMPRVWSAADRLLVAVGPSPNSGRLVRVAARLADSLDAPWHALLVRTTSLDADEAARERALTHLRLAEQLGATSASVASEQVAPAMVSYARQHNLTMLVLGASAASRSGYGLGRSLVDEVSRAASDLEVHVVPMRDTAPPRPRAPRAPTGRAVAEIGVGLALVGTATAIGWVAQTRLPESDVLMLYLGAVVLAAFRLQRTANMVTALSAVLAFNFFFTEPRFTFYFTEQRYLLTFLALGSLGVLVGTLAARVRERAAVATARELESRTLYRLARALGGAPDTHEIVRACAEHIGEVVHADVTVFLPAGEELFPAVVIGGPLASPGDLVTARWAMAHRQAAGAGTGTLPSGEATWLPLLGGDRVHGVIGVRAAGAALDDPDRRHLVETMADQVGLALERVALVADASAAVRSADAERTRASLLASVSHDLRTPLATITGAATTLLDPTPRMDGAARERLLREIVDESARLERLLQNLLQMTRLDADAVRPDLDWHVAQDLAGAAVARVTRSGRQAIHVDGPDAPVLVRVDGLLLDIALLNLVENAVRHGGAGPIHLAVRTEGDVVCFDVADRGPGVPAEAEALFGRFVRGAGSVGGAGLGLAIVRAVASLHGGSATAAPRDGGGAVFTLRLPQGGPDHAPVPELG